MLRSYKDMQVINNIIIIANDPCKWLIIANDPGRPHNYDTQRYVTLHPRPFFHTYQTVVVECVKVIIVQFDVIMPWPSATLSLHSHNLGCYFLQLKVYGVVCAHVHVCLFVCYSVCILSHLITQTHTLHTQMWYACTHWTESHHTYIQWLGCCSAQPLFTWRPDVCKINVNCLCLMQDLFNRRFLMAGHTGIDV